MATRKKASKPNAQLQAVGTLATEFLKLKKTISAKNKALDELKAKASELEKKIIFELESVEGDKVEKLEVKIGSVKLNKKSVYSVKNWKEVWKYIFKTKNEALLQKRLSDAAIHELYEDGVRVKGVERGTKKSLSYGFKKTV